MSPQSADRSWPDESGPEVGVLAVVPRLTQLQSVLARGRLVERAMEAADLRLDRPAMSALLILNLAEKPLRIGEIAQKMQVVGPHVTRQVQELERRGLVHRVKDPLDRRASLIEPTPRGAAAARTYMLTIVGWFTDAISDWSEQDRNDLGRLLGRFADDVTAHLRTLDDDGAPPPAES
ncbi:MarR family winged helix-turn-helix transcriptional regulator [Streptomyces corynorhini]|uniref:MarR family transcriptional regulator n=1 Tax=Streptomyces corynorhini TaxID=2282652 RepID=A0A370B8C8_9ACTN|nr:MarR family transcriptional regulator [Streptomyces corynorhini]RDG35996.1 MarR family transcriptional regulator [Streptomyces corynorhini]